MWTVLGSEEFDDAEACCSGMMTLATGGLEMEEERGTLAVELAGGVV